MNKNQIIEAIKSEDFFSLSNTPKTPDSDSLRVLEQKLAKIDAETAELQKLAAPSESEKAEFYRQFEEWRGNSDGSVGCD